MDQPEEPRLLRIAEVADEVGLTTRAIRYYEELGLLAPAARSDGAYRLYDADDVERLRLIKGLRDDAGFSLADIGRMVEDEAARARDRARFRATTDPEEQERLLLVAIERAERQLSMLQDKAARLAGMVGAARERRERLQARLDAVRAAEPVGVGAPRGEDGR
ncbi:MAG: MerR family transcriptional regulator [Chloroflexota bacterium]